MPKLGIWIPPPASEAQHKTMVTAMSDLPSRASGSPDSHAPCRNGPAYLDNDGQPEVIFCSWTQKGCHRRGKLHIVDTYGNLIHEIAVPPPLSGDWNGVLGAPTLANIDDDSHLEVVVGTAHSGICAYDLPGTANARVLWGAGRGNYQRSGSVLETSLYTSAKTVDRLVAEAGPALDCSITLQASGGSVLDGVCVTDTLPSEVVYAGDVWASQGSYGEAGGVIT